MKKNEDTNKNNTSDNKKLTPTQLKEKLFNHGNKTVPTDKKIVPVSKKQIVVDKKISITDKKIVPVNKKQIEADKKISTAYKKIVPVNKNIITTEHKTTTSSNNFQLKIFQEINKSSKGKNVMVSPISIYHILSLTANGAANKTLTEMLHALCEKNLIELNKKNNTISSLISKFKSVELANAVFTRFNPLDEFQKMIVEYRAKLDHLKDANQVNQWCSDATHKKIPKIVDNITGADKMVLINAIYFKGIWQQPFDKNQTHLDTFYGPNNQMKKIMFMNSTKKFDYYEDNGLQAISLNYTQDNLNALIILPKNKGDINNYIGNFTLEKYNMIIGNLTNKKVKLSLPRFEFDFSTELSQIFKSFGMKDAFTGSADFSVMRKEKDIYISRILHKTFIKVDEKGTEAAAVTAVVMRCTAALPPDPIPVMKVDHPFLFVIRNNDLQLGNDIICISKVENLK